HGKPPGPPGSCRENIECASGNTHGRYTRGCVCIRACSGPALAISSLRRSVWQWCAAVRRYRWRGRCLFEWFAASRRSACFGASKCPCTRRWRLRVENSCNDVLNHTSTNNKSIRNYLRIHEIDSHLDVQKMQAHTKTCCVHSSAVRFLSRKQIKLHSAICAGHQRIGMAYC